MQEPSISRAARAVRLAPVHPSKKKGLKRVRESGEENVRPMESLPKTRKDLLAEHARLEQQMASLSKRQQRVKEALKDLEAEEKRRLVKDLHSKTQEVRALKAKFIKRS
jgi:predicted  nucleic acid-binding Zn-ribbon protein